MVTARIQYEVPVKTVEVRMFVVGDKPSACQRERSLSKI